MKMPLIADEHGDILLFTSEAEASRYIEPIDIRNNEYIFYDAEGVYVEAKLNSTNKISFQYKNPVVCHAEELKTKLQSFLKKIGRDTTANSLALILTEVSAVIRKK